MALRYHAAAFANLQIEPEFDPSARELLNQQEHELGLVFPASVRELLEDKHAQRILRGVDDLVVPLAELGQDYSSDSPFLRIIDFSEGYGTCYVYLDGKDDPDVRFVGDSNDDLTDEDGRPVEVIGTFSAIVLEQTQLVLECEQLNRKLAERRAQQLHDQTWWSKFRQSWKMLASMAFFVFVLSLYTFGLAQWLRLNSWLTISLIFIANGWLLWYLRKAEW